MPKGKRPEYNTSPHDPDSNSRLAGLEFEGAVHVHVHGTTQRKGAASASGLGRSGGADKELYLVTALRWPR
eukprot:scaffold82084_cov31-Tisochrysis_lutea.AAC.2